MDFEYNPDALNAQRVERPLHATDHMQAHLQRVALMVQRHVARYAYRLLDSSGNLNDARVSLQEALCVLEGLTDAPARPEELEGSWDSLEDAREALERFSAVMDARFAPRPTDPAPPFLPIEEIRARFDLTPIDLALLIAAAAPQLSWDLHRLFAFAQADLTLSAPTAGFLAELIADAPKSAPLVLQRLAPHAPLARQRLIRLDADPRDALSRRPLLRQAVTVPDTVAAFVQGSPAPLPSALSWACDLTPATTHDPATLVFSGDPFRQAQRLLRRARGALRLTLQGDPGTGRRTLLGALCAPLGLGVLTARLERLGTLQTSPEELEARCGDVLREARLRGAVALWRLDEVITSDDLAKHMLPPLARALRASPDRVALAVPPDQRPPRDLFGALDTLALGQISKGDQRALWLRLLPDHPSCETAADRLSAGFNLTPGTIHALAAEAPAPPRRPKAPYAPLADLQTAALRRLEQDLDTLAEPLDTGLRRDDLVLDRELGASFDEIVAHSRHRARVYEEWGFDAKVRYGRSLSCLFSGPPGTGKTMMANVLATELGLQLYRVDVSRVVSKWLGETEKNLKALFDQAQRAQVMLLFDEADSLFAKRTSVKGSNDRYANMAVNYLLQRMETYDGISVLTTNLSKGIDEAFLRRIKFTLKFALPDAPERAKLWRSMLPTQAKLGNDIDLRQLAQEFEMSGGHIKNAVLRAAFRAAAANTPIRHAHLYQAALAEAREMGMLVRDGALR